MLRTIKVAVEDLARPKGVALDGRRLVLSLLLAVVLVHRHLAMSGPSAARLLTPVVAMVRVPLMAAARRARAVSAPRWLTPAPRPMGDACKDGVGLLYVDVAPHIRGERGRQGVEGEALDAVHQSRANGAFGGHAIVLRHVAVAKRREGFL